MWMPLCIQLYILTNVHYGFFWPSHPSWRPIFQSPQIPDHIPMFTANVSLVPCAISHNPLPRCQEPVLGYCPPHLFCVANCLQHLLFSPFIFGQFFPSGLLDFHSFPSIDLFCCITFSFPLNLTPEWNCNVLKFNFFPFFPQFFLCLFPSQHLID